ncbi:MAG TPA: hypothetical protein VKZ98_07655 [Aquaticitalea sp.]|nr:hypothetical protein [Aquaticitalea sp.]
MKKIIVAAAIILGGFTSYASATEIAITPIHNSINEENWKELPKEKLPQAVQDAFKADFKTATLNKAYVNDKQEYKLEFTIDGAASTVYADKDGNWIERKK